MQLHPARKVVVTGGAGFIGSALVRRLLDCGQSVTVLDSLARAGSAARVAALREHPRAEGLEVVQADIRHFPAVLQAVAGADHIYHLAAQVAVTTSIHEPREDFEVNALGTLNVLEAARLAAPEAALIYSSTNKVYGSLGHLPTRERETRYELTGLPHGVPESQPLDLHSPYGCSKGAADQYVRDYHRIYGLPTVVLRQSCCYGPGQQGSEDQGWVGWFLAAALAGQPLTIYGDGKQVRDLLFVDDLLAVYELAVERIDRVAGEIFNIGGGPANSISVWQEFGPLLQSMVPGPVKVTYGPWRPGDQRVYVSDIRKAEEQLGWRPSVAVEEGLLRLIPGLAH